MDNDIARNILIASIAAAPAVGGPIAFLLDKYLPSDAENRKKQYIETLAKEIDELKDSIKIENLETEEFKTIFIRLLKESIEEHREEKLSAFRKLTLNIALQPYEFNKVDFYTRLVISMVPDQIVILHVFYRLDVTKELAYLDKEEERKLATILNKLKIYMPTEYRIALVSDLMIMRLVSSNEASHKKQKRSGQFLTELGEDFCRYIFEKQEIFNEQ